MEVFLRRSLADSVLRAYAEQIDDRGARPDHTEIVLTVTTTMGDLRSLQETLVRVDISRGRTLSGER